MTISRRKLLGLTLGATQLGLLSKFGLLARPASAVDLSDRPTKLLTIYIPGGIHHEFVWSTFYDSSIPLWMPPAAQAPGVFYDASMVENLDRSGDADADLPIRRLRRHITWNWADPSDRSMGEPNNKGYVWAAPEYRLYENTAIIHGIDQGTAAHLSGVIASMCGLAGGNFVLPGIPAMIANHLIARFPDRPVPNLSIGGQVAAPALNLPSAVNPANVASVGDLEFSLSDRRPNWTGLKARQSTPRINFDGTMGSSSAPLTITDAAGLRAVRALRGRSSSGTDTFLEQLHDTYAGVSRTIARDIVDIIQQTRGVEHLPGAMPWTPNSSRFGWQINLADFYATDPIWANEFDLTLRMLKSDLATSVSFKFNPTFGFDSHFSNPYPGHSVHLRGAMESIGRLLVEMKLTPSPSRADRTLLDETLVYITSDFGRTFPSGGGSDHNPMHSAVLVNGMIQGNRMFGGYRDQPFGIPVGIREESGSTSSRTVNARDVAATIYACFGMEPNVDYFIPGGYGVVDGIARV